jgi:hypothetical protein
MKPELNVKYRLPPCKAIRTNGRQCNLEGLFHGFCVTHWRKKLLEKNKQKEKNKD